MQLHGKFTDEQVKELCGKDDLFSEASGSAPLTNPPRIYSV